MDGPLATMALALVIAFMMFAFPRTPAAIMPALAAFPRPVPAPGAIGGRVGVWNRSLDEAARQDRQGHHDQDPHHERAHFDPSRGSMFATGPNGLIGWAPWINTRRSSWHLDTTRRYNSSSVVGSGNGKPRAITMTTA